MSSIAFIIHNKNEEEVIRFCTSNKPLLVNSKIICTKTEKNAIETALDRKISYTSSLESKGDSSIGSKASKGEIAAIFYFNPPTESITGLPSLIQSCNKKKVYLAFDAATADTIIQMLVSEKVLTPATNTLLQRKESINKNMSQKQAKYQSRLIEFDPSEQKAERWSNQQLLYFLEQAELGYLKSVYFDTSPIEKKTRAELFTKHDTKSNLLQVKSGSVSDLVDLLVLSTDESLRNVFEHGYFVRDWFMTMHSFTTPKDFLELLKIRFNQCFESSKADEVKDRAKAVIVLLKTWIRMEFAAEFAEDDSLTVALKDFLKAEKDRLDFCKLEMNPRDVLDKNLGLFHNPPEPDLKNAPQPIIPKHSKDSPAISSISECDPLEIARQITILEANIFRSLRAKEFVRTAWTKKNARDIAPQLTRFIELSNKISNMIVTEILKQKSYEEMSELIIKFIKVGKHMLSFYNFSGVMEVVTALNNPAIGRLKNAWALIPTKIKDIFEQFSEIASPLGHYKNYRFAFHTRPADHPCIPIVAATLSDLNGYEEVFSNTTKDGAVNWAKMMKIADRIWELLSVNAFYEFKSVPIIQDFITTYSPWSDSLTTCAIADIRMKEITKSLEMKDMKKSSKRRSSSSTSLYLDQDEGARDTLSEKDWSYLLTGLKPHSFKAGQVLLAAGSPNDKLYRIKSGTVNVVKEVNGTETIVASMTENAMFGEISMLLRSQKGTATASIIAADDVEVWILNIEFVLTLLESKPHLAERLNRILALKLAQRLRSLNNKPSEKKELRKSSKEEVKESEDKVEKTEKPKASNLDKYLKEIGLDEVVIQLHECSVKNGNSFHGTMFITTNHLGFIGSNFGRKEKFYLPFTSILEVKKNNKYLSIIRNSEESLDFYNLEERDELYTFISSMWRYQQNSSSAKKERKKSEKKLKSSTGEKEEDIKSVWLPSPDDWDMILKGARTVTFQKDDVILKEGERVRRIFQLLRGECRFEKVIDGQTRVLGKLGKDGSDVLFGEISFLEGGKASASVVCDKDDTQVSIIEGYFLEVLFQFAPELAGRFYHYLAHVLSKRLKQRESTALSIPIGSPDSKKKKKKRSSQK